MLSVLKGEQLRAQVAAALHQAKPPKSNIMKWERQALKALAKDKSATILLADKGKATVIMDTDKYEKKVQEMLSNDKVYKDVKTNPASRYKRKLINSLTRFKDEKKITEEQY